MQTFFRLDHIVPALTDTVIALGTFDGIHLGHQAIISQAVKLSKNNNWKSVVFTFSNHPWAILQPLKTPPRITTLPIKQSLIEKLGVDILVSLTLKKDFLSLSPEDFVNLLHQTFRPKHIIVGPNYSFGHRGLGSPETLKQLGKKYNFSVSIHPPIIKNDTMVSSTLIRQLISHGKFQEAEALLGRRYFFQGPVVSGDQRGRNLGFPTANLALSPDLLLPEDGVYAVEVLVNSTSYCGLANIGNNPTFSVASRRIEVHLLEFQGDLYEKEITIFFLGKLRSEIRFSSVTELQEQISRDILEAQQIFFAQINDLQKE